MDEWSMRPLLHSVTVGKGQRVLKLHSLLTLLTTPFVTCYRIYVGALEGPLPRRSRPPPGGEGLIWVLGFANNRLTMAHFRDVRLLDV